MLDVHGATIGDVGPGSFIHGWTVGERRSTRIMRETIHAFSTVEADLVTVARRHRGRLHTVEVAIAHSVCPVGRLHALTEILREFNETLTAERGSYVH